MDFLKTIADQGLKPTNSTTTTQDSNKSSSGDLFGMISSAVSGKSSAPKQEEKKDEGGFMGALNNAMGGGKKGEEKEGEFVRCVPPHFSLFFFRSALSLGNEPLSDSPRSCPRVDVNFACLFFDDLVFDTTSTSDNSETSSPFIPFSFSFPPFFIANSSSPFPIDGLDKAIDMFQEHVLKQGPQNNESAIEQKKDDMIADAIRDGYKNLTGKEFFIKEK